MMYRFLPVLALLALLSCSGEKAEGLSSEVMVRVVGMTRVADSGTTEDIRTLDLLVFRASDGVLESRSRQTGSLSVSCRCSAGRELKWYLVANAPEELSFGTESAFLEGKTTLDDQTESIVMHAEGTVLLTETPAGIEARLKRYPCKVSLDALRLSWLDAEGAPGEIRLGRIALVNAVGTIPYSGIPSTEGPWYNQAAVTDDSPLLVMDHGGAVIPSSERFPCAASLYTLPNPTDNGVNSSNTATWCPRDTRLSVELLVDGVPQWYPVDLPGMVGNCHYRITELVVMGPGAAGPDETVDRNPVAFQLLVTPWDEVSSEIDFETE